MNIRKLPGQDIKNFVFLGEAGCGKSEIAISFSKLLKGIGDKEVHFFDLDMTKPLFRSRDARAFFENEGIVLHYEQQFMDAPTQTGGVSHYLREKEAYTILDVGGDDIGSRAIGSFATLLNKKNTAVYYVVNSYRPWSYDLDHIDETLAKVLGVSHILLDKVQIISNPNVGKDTTEDEFISGVEKTQGMISPYKEIAFSCIQEQLVEKIEGKFSGPIFPIRLYLTYEWNR